jgi:hypothetical protein
VEADWINSTVVLPLIDNENETLCLVDLNTET